MTTQHDQNLTLRDAFELYYHKEELAHHSQRIMRTAIGAWERLSDNLPVPLVDNAVIERFRQHCLQSGLTPRTTNGYWTHLRSILRRVGPVTDKNPWALDLFPGWRVPAMKPCTVMFKRPKRLSMDELNRLYMAARHMREPNRFVADPVVFWQGLLVFAYYTALRSADIFKARWSDVNFSERTIYVVTGKTRVDADLPLTDVAMDHLSRLYDQRIDDRIFHLDRRHLYDTLLKRFCEQAGVKFGLHDLRRTACSELNAVAPGMGRVIGLWKPTGVVEKSYLNSLPELRAALEKMACPIAFRHGPKMVIRAMKEARNQALKAQDFAVPMHPPREAFQFGPSGVSLAGVFVPLQPGALAILQTLAENNCIVPVKELHESLEAAKGGERLPRRTLHNHVARARDRLRKHLKLPRGFNPIVGRCFVQAAKTQGPGSATVERYELLLPPAIWQQDQKGGVA